MPEIQNPEIWTCLKSDLFVRSDFRHPSVSENQNLVSDFKHFTQESEIWPQRFGLQTHFEKSVWKLNFEIGFKTVSEIWTVWKLNSLDFRHSLYFGNFFTSQPISPLPQAHSESQIHLLLSFRANKSGGQWPILLAPGGIYFLNDWLQKSWSKNWHHSWRFGRGWRRMIVLIGDKLDL